MLRYCEICETGRIFIAGERFCNACKAATNTEAARGVQKIAEYLSKWTAFRDWEAQHQESGHDPLPREVNSMGEPDISLT